MLRKSQTVVVDEDGSWTVTFEDVPAGETTINAGDGASMTERMASTVDQGYAAVDNDDAVQALLAKLQRGEAVATGALSPEDPGEFDGLRIGGMAGSNRLALPCPSGLSDNELIAHLQQLDAEIEK